MNARMLLTHESLGRWIEGLHQGGRRLVGPRPRGEAVAFDTFERLDQLAEPGAMSALSPKEVLFPRVEPLFAYRRQGKDEVRLEAAGVDPRPVVLFGARPCDARGLTSLAALLGGEIPDETFEARRRRLTVVSMSCATADADCFCTSVGGGPGDPSGSDVLLTRLGDEGWLAEVVTEKGRALVAAGGELFAEAGAVEKDAHLAQVAPRFDALKLSEKLPGLFDAEDLWRELSLRCLGCGTCAFACPSCGCFDLQDEGTREHGARVRCWDACGFALFTRHASGHNPREVQSQRWRQRVMHKFVYMPEKLDVLGCVGCGRCSRACPADMNLGEHLERIAEA